LASALDEHFARPECGGTGAEAARGLRAADADALDGVLRAYAALDGIVVDRARLADSCEAWVHVAIVDGGALDGALAPFAPFPCQAVLVWPNSD
jgi:hypothetical protein